MVLALDTLPRKVLVALLAAGATLGLSLPIASHYRAELYSRLGTQENLEKALVLQPVNAELHNRLGRVLLYSPLGDAKRAIRELNRAVELDALSGSYWVDLALALELEGDTARAARSLARARAAEPRTPFILWHETNFLLRRGDYGQALARARELLDAAPDYSGRVLPVLARVVDPAVLVTEVVPQRTDALASALEFLRSENYPQAAEQTWTRVLRLSEPPSAGQIGLFVDWLISNRNAPLAHRVWSDAGERGWIPVDARESSQPLYNAGFEHAQFNFGFDWRIQPHPDTSVWIEASGPQPGQLSLCAQFTQDARGDYAHISHFLPVEPSYHYSLRGALRSERLYSRSGAYLRLRDYFSSGVSRHTEPITGTNGWKEFALHIETGPQTRLLQLVVVRPAPPDKEEPTSSLLCIGGLKWEPLGPARTNSGGGRP